MTIIKFDSIVEVSFVIQAGMSVPPKGGDITLVMKHAGSPPTQIILSEGFMYILRSHCLHLCIPLTLLTKCSCTIPVCYCVYIVKLRAVRDPPPFSVQKFIFFAVCSFFLFFVHFLANATKCRLAMKFACACSVCVCMCVWSLAVSAGGLNRQAALALSEAPASCLLEILYLLAWVSPKPLSPRRAPFASVHLNLSHRFDTASLGVHPEMTCI